MQQHKPLEEICVVNKMAQGDVCEDMSAYVPQGALPEEVARLVWGLIEQGEKLLEGQGQ